MIEMLFFSKEKRQKVELSNTLEILIGSSLEESLRSFNFTQESIKNIHNSLKNQIQEYFEGKEYFDEQGFVNQLKSIIGNALNIALGEDQNNQRESVIEAIFNSIITKDNNGKIVLSENWRNNLIEFFRKSPEKKGVNFRDQINDKDELRAWLYLCLSDESERKKFKEDFERALNQAEPIFYKLWPPSIANVFRTLVGSEPRLKEFTEGEFIKNVKAYLEDIAKGKNRITLFFNEDLLPDELKGKTDEDLRKLGVHKVNNEFEIYFDSERYVEILDTIRETYAAGLKEEIKIEKLLKEINDLFNELKRETPSEFKHRVNAYGEMLTYYLMHYQKAKSEDGLSGEDLNRLTKELDEFKKELNNLKNDIESYKSTKDPNQKEIKFREIMTKSGRFLLNAGKNFFSFAFSSIGLWSIALAWFLPLYLINVMYGQIEKGPFVKK